MTVSLIKETELCATCGAPCAPAPSWEIDPTCTACAFSLRARDTFLPIDTPHDLAFLLRDPADYIDSYFAPTCPGTWEDSTDFSIRF